MVIIPCNNDTAMLTGMMQLCLSGHCLLTFSTDTFYIAALPSQFRVLNRCLMLCTHCTAARQSKHTLRESNPLFQGLHQISQSGTGGVVCTGRVNVSGKA